jgi:carbamoyl-phosphate synthase large subunit
MPPKQLNVLVLGVGGNVSQGILKALAISSLPCRVVAACTSPGTFGLFTTDRSYVSPAAKDPGFLPWILDICRREEIHAVLSGVEPVLDALLLHHDRILSATGAICLANAPPAVAVGRDKLRTCEWLRDHGFAYPAFAASEDLEGLRALVASVGFPLLAKPRAGKGSSGIFAVSDQETLHRVSMLSGYVVQEVLGDDSGEFTTSCFTDRDDKVRGIIVLHRRLQHGTTVAATAGLFPDIRREAERMAAILRPRGPLNIQMRIHHERPVCFEMNVRFSGTTPMRARLGFNDVEAALRHYVLGEPAADLPLITSGHVIRYWNELYVEPEALAVLTRDGHLAPRKYPVRLEDYGSES